MCCKGQIIVHTSEVDGSEPEPEIQDDKKIYDLRIVWPYSLLLCSPAGCGKTTWIVELLKRHEELCTHTPKKLIWIYGVEQPDFFETIKKIWFPRQCEFVDEFHENLLTRLEQTSDRGSLCIFDDVMNEMSSNSMISKLFTCGRSHLGCSLVIMLQNIFPKHQGWISDMGTDGLTFVPKSGYFFTNLGQGLSSKVGFFLIF